MKKGSKNSPQRLTMSEPRKGKKAGNKGVSAKKAQSKTAQKMKPADSKSGAADLEEKQISMKLFQEETAVVTRSSKKKAQKKPQISTPKAAEKMPQADLDSSSQGDTTVNGSEQQVNKESNVSAKKKRTKRGRKSSQKMTATSTPESDNLNGKSLDSSLDSTLPLEADVRKTKKGKRKAEEGEDGVVSFPTTPALQIPSKKRKSELQTPAVTVKTPMPAGDEEWLSSSEATDGSAGEDISPVKSKKSDEKQVKQSVGKKLSAKERREKAKLRCPHILKCMNIPRGTKAAYLSLFFSEMDLNPQIKIKKLRQGGARSRTKGIRYAILTCKTVEERDQLLDLDEISLPSGTTGKEWKLRIVPQMTHQESKSNRSMRILNTPEDVTESDLKDFFSEKKVNAVKVLLYKTDKVAIAFFRSPMDLKRAVQCPDKTLKGSQMEFMVNKGYMNYDKYGKMILETDS